MVKRKIVDLGTCVCEIKEIDLRLWCDFLGWLLNESLNISDLLALKDATLLSFISEIVAFKRDGKLLDFESTYMSLSGSEFTEIFNAAYDLNADFFDSKKKLMGILGLESVMQSESYNEPPPDLYASAM